MKESANHKSRASKIIVGGIIVILLAVIAVFGYLLFQKSQAESPKPDSNIITSKPTTDIEKDMQAEADRNKIGVEMPITFSFKKGNPEGTLDITAKPENNFSFTATFIIDGEKDPVITTGLIAPGTTLPTGKLLRDLDVGEYPASAYLVNYGEDGKKISQTGVAVTIVVQE